MQREGPPHVYWKEPRGQLCDGPGGPAQGPLPETPQWGTISTSLPGFPSGPLFDSQTLPLGGST